MGFYFLSAAKPSESIWTMTTYHSYVGRLKLDLQSPTYMLIVAIMKILPADFAPDAVVDQCERSIERCGEHTKRLRSRMVIVTLPMAGT